MTAKSPEFVEFPKSQVHKKGEKVHKKGEKVHKKGGKILKKGLRICPDKSVFVYTNTMLAIPLHDFIKRHPESLT